MKIRRSVLMPIALLIYLAAMAVYAWPGRNPNSTLSYTNYWATIGVTLACILALTYFLKRRDKFRNENKENKQNKPDSE